MTCLCNMVGKPCIIGGDIPATILAVERYEGGHRIRVSWWDDRHRHDEWLAPCEVDLADNNENGNGTTRGRIDLGRER